VCRGRGGRGSILRLTDGPDDDGTEVAERPRRRFPRAWSAARWVLAAVVVIALVSRLLEIGDGPPGRWMNDEAGTIELTEGGGGRWTPRGADAVSLRWTAVGRGTPGPLHVTFDGTETETFIIEVDDGALIVPAPAVDRLGVIVEFRPA